MIKRALNVIYKLHRINLEEGSEELPIVNDVYSALDQVKKYFPGSEGVVASVGETQTEREKKQDTSEER